MSALYDLANTVIPGLTADENIRLVKRIGAGGFGTVYTAWGHESDFAVKCTPASDDPKSLEHRLMQKEITAHRKVSSHPNVVSYYTTHVQGGVAFHVMNHVRGGNLFNAIRRGAFDNNAQHVKNGMLSLLGALQYAHQRGVYHCDIKPENILCCREDGTGFRLADFGVSTESPTTRFVGTDAYIPPEGFSWRNKAYSSAAADKWAATIVLINMLGGDPWAQADFRDSFYTEFRRDEKYLNRTCGVTAKANAFLRRCLAEDPAARPSIEEMMEELASIDKFTVDGFWPERPHESPTTPREVSLPPLPPSFLLPELDDGDDSAPESTGLPTPLSPLVALVKAPKSPSLGRVLRRAFKSRPVRVVAQKPVVVACAVVRRVRRASL
ncbi:Protein kinase domain-containing protein [Mycena chlorophos]|uniref:Protein kinase domain-containing protein n=1 Tax=Mycena chlorophos TaxID=658473 RepID=A0A8H6S093_MYCCL|nr:Protein kinase domain-containing protein [Mycena chlorophos]